MVTHYAQIAPNYDKNPIRAKGVDEAIKQILQKSKGTVRVLDLACGTGSYLKAQSQYYSNANIEWIGIDKSKEMLRYAQERNKNTKFVCDAIETLENMETNIDYIRNEFAFHHFTDKEAAVRNINGMLKLDGTYIMINVCPDYTNNSGYTSIFHQPRKSIIIVS